MQYRRVILFYMLTSCVMQAVSVEAIAQNGFPVEWLAATPSSWSIGPNWQGGLVPEAAADEFAVINAGTAFVEGAPLQPGGVILGRDAGQLGVLEIRSGGNLVVVADPPTDGRVIVGQNGSGALTIQSGGRLAAAAISSNNVAGTSITLNGSAQLAVGSASLNGVTNIVGQAATFTASQGVSFGANSRTQIDISGTAAPQIRAGGNASLGGVLEVEFFGPTPAVGSTWNLFDAGAVNGQFSQVNVTNGSLGLGQRLRVRPAPSPASVNGVFGQLVFEQLLVLEVNRDTGALRIRNPSTSIPISIDGYSITSTYESFNPANSSWNSLADQSRPGWIEANPKSTQLNELGTEGLTLLPGGGQLTLGTPWHPQYAALGQSRDDIVFRYAAAGGELITAPVVYTGVHVNDVALVVDPVTGHAQLRNASYFDVGIEGYTILSTAGSLNPGSWSSLEDNPAANDWLEANPTSNALSELKTAGVEVLAANKAFNLGQLFSTANQRDLILQYYVAGSTVPTLGKVVYQSIPVSPAGDFDLNGLVDGNDVLAWQRGLGSAFTAGDLAVWKTSFGSQIPVVAQAPEPSSLLLLCGTTLGAAVASARRSRTLTKS